MALPGVEDDEDSELRQQDDPYRPELAYGAPPAIDAEDDVKVAYAIARYTVQDDHYHGLHQQWVKPIYFLVGKQWLKWESEQGSYVVDTDVPEWRQQPVTNWTWAIYRTLIAKLTKQRPTLDVVPPSGDSEDRESAKMGEAILQHLWRLLKCPQKMQRAIGWLLATGNVYLKAGWDPNAGEVKPRTVLVEVPDLEAPTPLDDAEPIPTVNAECPCDENGEPYLLPDGTPDLEHEPDLIPIGEWTFDVVDPLSHRWDPDATSEDDAVEAFEARMVPVETLAQKYGISADDIKKGGESGEDREALDDALESAVAGSPDAFDAKWTSMGSSRRGGGTSNRALELRYYAKPNAAAGYPHGRHWIVAGGTKVWPKAGDEEFPNGEAPLPHGFWPPCVSLLDTPIPGQPEAGAVLAPVVTLNEKLNYVDGKIGEYHTTMAMGGVIFVHPDDKGMKITSEPGQVKVSRGMAHGHPPIREKLESLPAAVYEERNVITANMQAIAGTSQLDLGQRPEGVTAGRAFLVIQEASDAAIGPTLMALENAMEELGRRWLVLTQMYCEEERTIAIRGERGQWEYRSFKNSDLVAGLDVRVMAGSSFPWSKSAQFDTKIQLIEALPQRVIRPDGTVDEAKFAKLLEPGSMGLQSFGEDGDADLDEIALEHSMFEEYDPSDPTKSNQLPQLGFWQNQVKHQDGHFEFMKRSQARFKRWSKPAQLAFLEHCRLTMESVQMSVQALMPPMDGAGATGDAGAGGSAPASGGAPGGGGQAVPKGASPLKLTSGDRRAAGVGA